MRRADVSYTAAEAVYTGLSEGFRVEVDRDEDCGCGSINSSERVQEKFKITVILEDGLRSFPRDVT